MADSAINAESLEQMKNLSEEDLAEGVVMFMEAGEEEQAELWNAELIRRSARAPTPPPTKLTTGETLSGKTGKSAIEEALGAISKPMTKKESVKQRSLSALETGGQKPAAVVAELEHLKRINQAKFDKAQAQIKYDREALQIEKTAKREIDKNTELAKLLKTKNDRIKQFKDLEDEKDIIRENAKTEFRVRQGEIRQAMIAFQSRNPYKTVFQSSFGIAASFIGALRQSLFGGENEAVKFLNDKVNAMVRQNEGEYSLLNQELSQEEGLFKNILDLTGDQMDDIYQQKQMFLDDVENAIDIINEKYSINLTSDQYTAAKQALEDTQASIMNDVAQSGVDRDISIIKGQQALDKRMQKSSLQERQELTMDDPTIEKNISKEFREDYNAATAELAAVNKVVETAIDLVMKDAPKKDRDTLWRRYVTKGFAALPDIFSHLSQVLGDDNRAWLTVKARMLEGEQMAQAFQIARREQGGSRITEKDFLYTYKRIAQFFASPQAFQEQAAKTINMAIEKIDSLNYQANQRPAYSDQGSLALNAYQKWLLSKGRSPTYLGPYVADRLRKRLNLALRNKSRQGERNALLTDEQLLQIQEEFPEVTASSIGEEALRFSMGDAYEAPYVKTLGIWEGGKAIGRGLLNLVTPAGEAETGQKIEFAE